MYSLSSPLVDTSTGLIKNRFYRMACPQTQTGVILFGVGRAGQIHFGNIRANPRMHLLYIVDADVNKGQDIVDTFHLQRDVKVLHPDSAEEALKDPNVSAVIVCSPTFTHEEIVQKALQYGKAVFCEKPISENTEGTKTCYEVAESACRPLVCSFNRRFDPSIASLRNRVKAGEIGQVHSIRTCSRDSPLPPMEYLKISGGIFHDCAVHDIDMVCWILEEFPNSVFTIAHAHNKEIEQLHDVDTVVIVMKFPSGVLSTIELSRNSSYGYDQRLEVFGSDGMVVSENQRPTEMRAYSKDGCQSQPYKYSFPQRYADSYIAALNHFLDVIEGKSENLITKKETLNVSLIASACEESLKTGQPVMLKLT